MGDLKEQKLDFIEDVPSSVNNLFIWLHGYGTTSADIMEIGMKFRAMLPCTAFVALNAPNPCDSGVGFQWFSLKDMNMFSMFKQIRISYGILNKFIDEQLERFHLSGENLFIGGFSQGAMMTLYTGYRREVEPLCLLSFSGMLPDTNQTLGKDIKSKPETCLIHGTKDVVVPFVGLEKSEYIINNFGIPCSTRIIEGMEHEVNDEAIANAKEFLMDICNRA
jgi:phospholipase/carboxylesterase